MVEVKRLEKEFRETKALDSVSLRFDEGQIHGLIGRNGSGKTVLLKLLCGLMAPTRGEVWITGEPYRPDRLRESMGILIEAPGFLDARSGLTNLLYLAAIRGKIGREQVRETMRSVGLDPDNRKPVRKYSMGMRQRLGIAQAIMEDPDILLLDEPTNGLDRQGVEELRTLLLGLRARGKIIVLASHSREDINLLCDVVTELESGRIVRSGKTGRNNR